MFVAQTIQNYHHHGPVKSRSNCRNIYSCSCKNTAPENLPPCLKLLVDCWEHILDYLSLKDIHAMGETCKPFNHLAGHYFREYLPNLDYELVRDDVYPPPLADEFALRPDFYQFISKLKIQGLSKKVYILNAETFSSLKMLIFEGIDLSETRLGYAQNVLKNIEYIELNCSLISSNIFKQLTIDCPKLTCLTIHCAGMEDIVINELFSQHYPQLEHFQIGLRNVQINQLKMFLEKHPKLKRFSTNFKFLWINRNVLNETNVQLNMLKVLVDEKNVPVNGFVNFLKALYEHSFYKQLHLSFEDCTDMDLNLCRAIYEFPALQKLDLDTDLNIDLSRLIYLNELYVHTLIENDLENVARSLIHLKRLVINEFAVDQMFSFIRHSKRLKEFIVDDIIDLDRNKILDLFAFNEERKKLVGACQISIGVQEGVYLPTKWCTKNSNLSHVKIIRFDRLMTTAIN